MDPMSFFGSLVGTFGYNKIEDFKRIHSERMESNFSVVTQGLSCAYSDSGGNPVTSTSISSGTPKYVELKLPISASLYGGAGAGNIALLVAGGSTYSTIATNAGGYTALTLNPGRYKVTATSGTLILYVNGAFGIASTGTAELASIWTIT
jgi:hypothetical protein